MKTKNIALEIILTQVHVIIISQTSRQITVILDVIDVDAALLHYCSLNGIFTWLAKIQSVLTRTTFINYLR